VIHCKIRVDSSGRVLVAALVLGCFPRANVLATMCPRLEWRCSVRYALQMLDRAFAHGPFAIATALSWCRCFCGVTCLSTDSMAAMCDICRSVWCALVYALLFTLPLTCAFRCLVYLKSEQGRWSFSTEANRERIILVFHVSFRRPIPPPLFLGVFPSYDKETRSCLSKLNNHVAWFRPFPFGTVTSECCRLE
jgi:hypothetical protein